MSTPQPKWKLVAQLGDVHPIDHGGYFVYVDEAGVYDPEVELLIPPEDWQVEADDRARDKAERQLVKNYEKTVARDATNEEIDTLIKEHLDFKSQLKWRVYRFVLEPCTYINGILSDNKYHPSKAAWFAKPESERKARPQDTTYLKNIADFVGITVDELAAEFTAGSNTEGLIKRALAWRAVGEYHGFENLDSYPLDFDRAEVEQRYAEELSGKPTTKGNK
jgi:hypothetical protein